MNTRAFALSISITILTGCSEEEPTVPGEALYAVHCIACHGSDGISGHGTDLDDVVPSASNEELTDVITFGIGDMPAIDITDQEALDIVSYLRALFP